MRGYHPRTCVRCGAVMKGTIRRKYCSPKCKVYAYRERKDAARADAFFRAHDLSLAPSMPNDTHRYPKPWMRRLYLPAYLVKDAARYAGISPHTVAYWHYRGGRLGPALSKKERRVGLSYLQLIEVAVVATLRNFGVPLQRIRKARDYLSQVFNSEYPFAQLRVKTEGFYVLKQLLEIEPDPELSVLVVADAGGQLGWEHFISDRFAEFEYDEKTGLAVKWHVAGHGSRVIIDPRISFGAPSISGVPTWALGGRAKAGESVGEIAEDFGLEPDQVSQALEFEGVPPEIAA